MDTLQGVLLNHRHTLIAYMEEWSRQQEEILDNYACNVDDCRRAANLDPTPDGLTYAVGTDVGEDEGAFHSGHDVTPKAEEPWALFSEQAVCKARPPSSERVGALGQAVSISHTLMEPTEGPVGDSHQLPFGAAEKAVIKAALPSKSMEISQKHLLQQPQNTWFPRLVKIVDSSKFGFAISGVILCNVVFMAISADHILESMKQGQRQEEAFIIVGESIFTCIYIVELLLKLVRFKSAFFCGRECLWNLFDSVIVLSALFDLFAPLLMDGSINISYLRMNRLIKLVKMLRVVTVYRSFKELRLIISSIMGCAKTMFWSIALLGTVLFVFSLFFVQAVTEYVKTRSRDTWNDDILEFWGSTRIAMITLFQAGTGGEDWARSAFPLWDLGWVYYAAFMLYICFFMFVVVNILTALFVDAALDHSTKDASMLIREQIQNKHEYIRHIRTLYRRLDRDGGGELSWDEFSKGLHSADMLAFASALDIEISDIREFFKLISGDGQDVVDIENFVIGCMKLKGPAKNFDLVSLLHRTRRVERATANMANQTDEKLRELRQMIGRVLSEQQRNSAPPREPAARGPLSMEKHSARPNLRTLACTPSPCRFTLLAPDFVVP